MTDNQTKVIVTRHGVGFCGILFIILLLLKVGVVETAVMGWSWVWIFSPLWSPVAMVVGILLIIAIFVIIGILVAFAITCFASIIKKIKK